MEKPCDADFDVPPKADPRFRILQLDGGRVVIDAHLDDFGLDAEADSPTVPLDCGRSQPARGLGGDRAETCRAVETARHPLRTRGDGEAAQRLRSRVGELLTPVAMTGTSSDSRSMTTLVPPR